MKNLPLIMLGIIYGKLAILLPLAILLLFPKIEIGGNNYLIITIIMIAIGIIGAPIFNFLANLLISVKEEKTRNLLKVKLVDKFKRMNEKRFNEKSIEYIDGDIDQSMYLQHRLYFDISSHLMIILLSLSFIVYNEKTMIFPILFLVIIFFVLFYIGKIFTKNSFNEYLKYQNIYFSYTLNKIKKKLKNNSKTIRVFSDKFRNEYVKSNSKVNIFSSLSSIPYMASIFIFSYFIIKLDLPNEQKVFFLISISIFIEKLLSSLNYLANVIISNKESFSRLNRLKENLE